MTSLRAVFRVPTLLAQRSMSCVSLKADTLRRRREARSRCTALSLLPFSVLFPKPSKRVGPNLKRRREIKRRDRHFQMLPAGSVCAVGRDCFGPLCKHHLKRRRFTATRHDDSNQIILCWKHHAEGHSIGPSRFKGKYGVAFV